MDLAPPAARAGTHPGTDPGTGPARTPSRRPLAPHASLAGRLVLAAVLAASGWPKLTDPDGTLRSVRAFRLLPEAVVPAFGYALPAVELVLAALLLAGLVTRAAAAVAAGLLVMFLIGIAAAWARGMSIDCGCFGVGGATVADPVRGYVIDLLRDAALLALAGWLVLRPSSPFSADRRLGLSPLSPR
jgi:uncharacterized membrane protein YphA (DoxX/SURF4 family)